jgi:hypothetical protein
MEVIAVRHHSKTRHKVIVINPDETIEITENGTHVISRSTGPASQGRLL